MTAVSVIPDLAARLTACQPDGCRRQVMHHRWESLLFLHWQVPVDLIQETLPKGLAVDRFNDAAYLGIIPFFMRNVRPVGLPEMPWISDFQELNVRTYVFDRAGVPGVWFYSLDCNQPLAVMAARTLTGLNYRHAEMTGTISEFIDYSCRRNGTEDVARYRYRGVGEANGSEPGSLEFFLLERYYFYSMRLGSLVRAQVAHVPYRFREAEVEVFSTIPAQLAGFADLPAPPEHACFVDSLEVKIYATAKIA